MVRLVSIFRYTGVLTSKVQVGLLVGQQRRQREADEDHSSAHQSCGNDAAA